MIKIMEDIGVSHVYTTRINYVEILSGVSINAKTATRKFLQQFAIIEFDKAAAATAANLSMRYRVGSKQSKDFLIAAIANSNKIPLLTENDKDFEYKEIKVIPYRIVNS